MDTTIVLLTLLSVLLMPLAGYLAHRRYAILGLIAVILSFAIAGFMANQELSGELQRIMVLVPASVAIAMYVWWAKTNRVEPAIFFWVCTFGHAWFMKAVFMQYE